MTRCETCALAYGDHPPPGVVDELQAAVRAFVARLRAAAQAPRARLVRRPAAGGWSALEYACHMRDVLLVQRERLLLALVDDTPAIVTMHRDHRSALSGYAAADAVRVATHLEVAAELFVDVAARLDDAAWRRTCIYNHPEPTEVDLAWVAAHTLHEVVHHLDDFDRALGRASAGA